MKQNKLKVIGITGGIGAGKSTASSFLNSLGIPVIDADKISKELLNKGTDVYSQIISEFGQEVIDESGEIDRVILGEIVFSDKKSLEKLNNLVHSNVAKQIKKKLMDLESHGHPLAILDVPLPVEIGFLDKCNRIWVIRADIEIRISRLMDNRGYTRNECIKRIESQPSQESYENIADLVIDNSSNHDVFKKELSKHIMEYRKDLE